METIWSLNAALAVMAIVAFAAILVAWAFGDCKKETRFTAWYDRY